MGVTMARGLLKNLHDFWHGRKGVRNVFVIYIYLFVFWPGPKIQICQVGRQGTAPCSQD
jgi:hypothetical protein